MTQQKDVLLWPNCPDGEYTVKLGYKQLCEDENSAAASMSDGSLQQSFWKIQVPYKIKVFLWWVCLDALPTKVNLKKRKVLEDDRCFICLSAQETTFHAIWSCNDLEQIWFPCFSWVKTEYPNIRETQELVNLIGL